MDALRRIPLWLVAIMVALVAVATTNVSGLGIGSGALTYDTIALPRLAITLVLTCAAWTAWFWRAAREGEPMRADAVWVLLGALAVWAAVSATVSPHRNLAVLGQSERLEGAVTVALYALLYGLALQVVRSSRDARVVISAIAAAAGLLSVYGIVQYAGLDPANYSIEAYGFEAGRAFATTGNPNFLAGLLVLALPLQVAIAGREVSTPARVGWIAACVVTLAALFLTFTRGAWIALLAQLFLTGFVWWQSRGRRAGSTTRLIVVLSLTVTGLLVVSSLVGPRNLNVVDRVADAISEKGSINERLLAAPIAFSAFLERPLFGYGPDAFLPAFRMHRTDEYAVTFDERTTLNNAHSWPVQYAATLGAVGSLLITLVLGLGLWRTRRLAFARKGGADVRADEIVMIGAWLGCAGFIVHMLFNVAVPGSAVPFWVLFGVVASPFAKDAVVPGTVARVTAGAAAMVTVAALLASAALLTADATYLRSRKALRGALDEDAAPLAERALALNPLSVKYSRGAAEAYAARVETAIGMGDPAVEVLEVYEDAAVRFQRHLDRNPNDYVGLAWLAALQARTSLYADDAALASEARTTARLAEEFDRHAEAVAAIAAGDITERAVAAAAGVPGLP